MRREDGADVSALMGPELFVVNAQVFEAGERPLAVETVMAGPH